MPVRRVVSWIVCLAALCGAGVTYSTLPHDFDPGPNHPGWLQRYEALKDHVGPAPEVMLVADDSGGTPRYKVFRAQFVLAPAVIRGRSLDSLDIRRLDSMPLVLDASSTASLDDMVRDVRGRAARRGIEVSVERALRTLAVVRSREAP